MGNDGGSIPRRSEMVREKQKDEKADRKNQLIAMYFYCALSKKPLQPPVVADGLGRLYNRESVLEYLLDNSAFGDGTQICGHIKSLKDVKTLNLKTNPAYEKNKKSTAILSFDDQPVAQFVCPVTMKEMNGNMQFEFLWSCGCVFSAQARKEMPEPACLVCGEAFGSKDLVPINAQDSEVLDALRKAMDTRKQEEKDKKKHKSDAAKQKSKNKHKRNHDSTEHAASSANDIPEKKTAKIQRTAA